ncbi:MAG TPA: hypothetical protein VMU99_01115 [Acidimicrobiales bacterium]|nr:hypothetical protein [Acidimicrobiales bacterium]
MSLSGMKSALGVKTNSESRMFQEPDVDGARLGAGERGESLPENFTTIGALGKTPVARDTGVVPITVNGVANCVTGAKERPGPTSCEALADAAGKSTAIASKDMAGAVTPLMNRRDFTG